MLKRPLESASFPSSAGEQSKEISTEPPEETAKRPKAEAPFQHLTSLSSPSILSDSLPSRLLWIFLHSFFTFCSVVLLQRLLSPHALARKRGPCRGAIPARSGFGSSGASASRSSRSSSGASVATGLGRDLRGLPGLVRHGRGEQWFATDSLFCARVVRVWGVFVVSPKVRVPHEARARARALEMFEPLRVYRTSLYAKRFAAGFGRASSTSGT